MFKKRQNETPGAYLPLQNDPLLVRMNKNGSTRTFYPFMIGMAAFIAIIELITLLSTHRLNQSNTFSIIAWTINGCLFTLTYYQQTFALRYWKKKLHQRPYALMNQQQLFADRQPQAIPTHDGIITLSSRVKNNRTILILLPPIIFIIAYVFLFEGFVIQPLFPLNATTFMITIAIIILLWVGLLVLILTQQKPSRIIVDYNGIASILNDQNGQNNQNKEHDAIAWQGARLFSTYIGPRSFLTRTPVRYFELAGDWTIVRWQWHDETFNRFTFTPALSKQEYDACMQQILNQVVTYTGLPLVDLDKLDKNGLPTHRG